MDNPRARPALFLDRDGVVVEEKDYLSDPAQLALIPGAAEAIAAVNAADIPVVVVTNQSGIARGYFSEQDLRAIHARLDEMLGERGAHIDRYFYCPHHPTEGRGKYRVACDCRKPSPGMLLRAAREMRLSLERSYLVGDKLGDLEAAARAGARAILVRTGYGAEQAKGLDPKAASPIEVVADLAEAVRLCLPRLLSP